MTQIKNLNLMTSESKLEFLGRTEGYTCHTTGSSREKNGGVLWSCQFRTRDTYPNPGPEGRGGWENKQSILESPDESRIISNTLSLITGLWRLKF